MKTYLFSDIDGTFLQGHFLSSRRKQFKPTDSLVQATAEFIGEGNELIFSTGRRYKSVRTLEQNAGLPANYIISMNGALVYGPDDTELRRIEIPKHDVQTLMTLLKEKQLLKKLSMFTSYMDTKNIVDTQRHPQFFFRFIAKKFAGMVHHHIHIQSEIEEGVHSLIKFVVVGNKKVIEQVRQVVEESDLLLETFKSSDYSLEVCAKGANKGDAIRFVMDHKKANGQIAYVGDSENDISGLQCADLGFAIKDGDTALFQYANHQVKNVEEAISIIQKQSK
ncbi:MAG: HAD-IIB family hydrolase [Culicoidibacterales bacterium]